MKTDSVLQSAAFKMSDVVTPALAAADITASLTEWALNMPVSMPAFPSRDFSHLANVEELTGVCGLTTARNSLVHSASSRFRKDSVLQHSQRLEKRIQLLAFLPWIVWPAQLPGILPPREIHVYILQI